MLPEQGLSLTALKGGIGPTTLQVAGEAGEAGRRGMSAAGQADRGKQAGAAGTQQGRQVQVQVNGDGP